LRRKSPKAKLLPPKVPGYIVTFSDMVTLLLTFFVMLLTLANEQDPELFAKGRDSFIESLRYFGLGVLFGRQDIAALGNFKTKHYISNDEQTLSLRTLDAHRERLRRVLDRIQRDAKVIPSDIVAQETQLKVTDIRFAPGRAELNEKARESLLEFCLGVREAGNTRGMKICVLGLAPDEPTPAQQWQVSARRAKAVADFLNDQLGADLQRPVCSWGAGPGGQWVGKDSPISEKVRILITVLRTEDQ